MRTVGLVVVCALLAGCGSDTTGPLGFTVWGGIGASMSLTTSGATFEFDCAHGRLDRPLALLGSRFSEEGVYVREGGPVPEDPDVNAIPARYDGEIRGSTLSLTVVPSDSGEPIGPYLLHRGEQPQLRKCL